MQKIIMRISALVTLILLMIIGIMISQGYQLPTESEKIHHEKEWYLQVDQGEKRQVKLPFGYTYG